VCFLAGNAGVVDTLRGEQPFDQSEKTPLLCRRRYLVENTPVKNKLEAVAGKWAIPEIIRERSTKPGAGDRGRSLSVPRKAQCGRSHVYSSTFETQRGKPHEVGTRPAAYLKHPARLNLELFE
jgi:hypothetical protein